MSLDIRNTEQTHILPQGTMLRDRYRIERVIGEGGFGITYEGTDTVLNLRVCVKEFYLNGSVTRDTTHSNEVSALVSESSRELFTRERAKFLQEARILAKCAEDPHVVTVRDYFEENNTAYIVMEYLEGMSLSELLKTRGQLSEAEILHLFVPVMESLSRLHDMGLIHRDLGPDNMILIGGSLKLIDFGASTAATGRPDEKLSVIIKGGYSPVEQYKSDGIQGPWTDVYALAATMYKCLTGKAPANALDRLIQETLRRPSELGIPVDRYFEDALLRGLALDYHNRWQTMDDFLLALTAKTRPGFTAEAGVHTAASGARDTASVAGETVEEDEEDEEATRYGGSVSVTLPGTDSAGKQAEKGTTVPAGGTGKAGEAASQRSAVKAPKAPHRKKKVSEKSPKTLPKKPAGKIRNIGIAAAVAVGLLVIFGVVRYNTAPVVLFEDEVYPQRISRDTQHVTIWGSSGQVLDAAEVKKLEKLKNLQILAIKDCRVEDDAMAEIANLPDGLVSFTMDGCYGFTRLPDFPALEGLQQVELTEDDLTDDMLEGSHLGSLPGLKECAVTDNPEITTLDFLTGAEDSLEGLWISGTGIHDLTGAGTFTNLTLLSAKYDRISDLAPVSSLTALRKLFVSYNNLPEGSLSALEDLADLEVFCAADNGIADLAGLSGKENLRVVVLNNNQITDLSPLEGLPALEQLEVMDNKITDLSPLASSVKLSKLFVSGNTVETLDPLVKLPGLTELKAADCGLTEIDALQYQQNLRTLVLDDNQIPDAEPLATTAPELQLLSISNNPIGELSSQNILSRATGLTVLLADNCRLTTADFLQDNNTLEVLSLADNALTELPAFTGGSVKLLDLGNNKLTALDLAGIGTDADYMDVNLNHNRIEALTVTRSHGGMYYRTLCAADNPVRTVEGSDLYSEELWLTYTDGTDYSALAGGKNVHITDVPDTAYTALANVLGDTSGMGGTAADADVRFAEIKADNLRENCADLLYDRGITKENATDTDLTAADDPEEAW